MQTVNEISISHVTAQQLLDCVMQVAAAMQIVVSACVVDRHGRVKAKVVMDGSPLIADELVERKAHTALSGLSTAEFAEAVANLPAVRDSMLQLDNTTLLAGGVPIVYQQQVIGALAVGGASTEQDRLCAEEALKQLLAQ